MKYAMIFLGGYIVGTVLQLIVNGSSQNRDERVCAESCNPAAFSRLDVQRGCICGTEVKK